MPESKQEPRPRPLPPGALPFLQNGASQVAQVVEDLDRTVEEYWMRFGVGPWDFWTYQKPLLSHQSYRGRPSDYCIRIALCWMGPTRVELIQPVRGPSVHEDFVRAHGYGVQHLGVLVTDWRQAARQAKDAGIGLLMDGGGFGLDGDGYYGYLDTEPLLGVTIELIQRPKRRRPPEKVYPA
jgi:methylmalonyl-CoA/ethylmalonyl-CoA epimerase